MYLPELIYPGIRVDGNDESASFEAEIILGELDSSFLDAALSLELFAAGQEKLLGAVSNMSTGDQSSMRELQRLPFLYAKSFLHALYDVRKLLGALADSASHRLDEVRSRFDLNLPELKGVRDSTEHIEERLQGQARRRPIQSSIRWIGNLNGNRFEMMMENGQIGRLEISKTSPSTAGGCIQDAIDCFEWTGPVR